MFCTFCGKETDDGSMVCSVCKKNYMVDSNTDHKPIYSKTGGVYIPDLKVEKEESSSSSYNDSSLDTKNSSKTTYYDDKTFSYYRKRHLIKSIFSLIISIIGIFFFPFTILSLVINIVCIVTFKNAGSYGYPRPIASFIIALHALLFNFYSILLFVIISFYYFL